MFGYITVTFKYEESLYQDKYLKWSAAVNWILNWKSFYWFRFSFQFNSGKFKSVAIQMRVLNKLKQDWHTFSKMYRSFGEKTFTTET